MPRFTLSGRLEADPSEAFAWHARPGAFRRLVPPASGVRVEGPVPPLEEGSRLELSVGLGPLRVPWTAQLRRVEEGGGGFTAAQVRGPFSRWVHRHRFLPEEGGTRLVDEVEWRLPAAPLTRPLAEGMVRRRLERAFRWRHARVRHDLERHREAGGRTLRIAVTGSSGLVGEALCAFLAAGGHRIHRVVRGTPRREADEVPWRPSEGRIEAEALEGVDAVVHLAGESLFSLRWSAEKKRRIRDSRVRGTRLLAEALAGLERKPEVLVSASAIGYYGDRGDEPATEASPRGAGFLAEVCEAWEEEADPARDAGIRVVHPRIGIVLAAGGGALAAMLPAFRLGLGGPIGDGRRWMSWIGLDDLVGVLHRLLLDRRLSGPVNAVAPTAVTNLELTRALGQVLGRPTFFRVPEGALRLAMGEVAEETVLASVRARSRLLADEAFRFRWPDLDEALRWELGRPVAGD